MHYCTVGTFLALTQQEREAYGCIRLWLGGDEEVYLLARRCVLALGRARADILGRCDHRQSATRRRLPMYIDFMTIDLTDQSCLARDVRPGTWGRWFSAVAPVVPSSGAGRSTHTWLPQAARFPARGSHAQPNPGQRGGDP